MIIASIQNKASNEEHTVAKNGVILSGNEKIECLREIGNSIGALTIRDEEEKCIYAGNGRYFCFIYHPEKDHINRTRTALVLFDKNISNEECRPTIEVMGLDWNKFCELRAKHRAMVQKKITKVIVTFIIFIVALFIVLK